MGVRAELEQGNLTLVMNNRSLMSLNYSFPVLLCNCDLSLSSSDDVDSEAVNSFGLVANIDEQDLSRD